MRFYMCCVLLLFESWPKGWTGGMHTRNSYARPCRFDVWISIRFNLLAYTYAVGSRFSCLRVKKRAPSISPPFPRVLAEEVWKKISRQDAKRRGLNIIKVRWIDINKGDTVRENYRSRLVQDNTPHNCVGPPGWELHVDRW